MIKGRNRGKEKAKPLAWWRNGVIEYHEEGNWHSLVCLVEAVLRVRNSDRSFLYFWIFGKVAVSRHMQGGRIRYTPGTALSGYRWREGEWIVRLCCFCCL